MIKSKNKLIMLILSIAMLLTVFGGSLYASKQSNKLTALAAPSEATSRDHIFIEGSYSFPAEWGGGTFTYTFEIKNDYFSFSCPQFNEDFNGDGYRMYANARLYAYPVDLGINLLTDTTYLPKTNLPAGGTCKQLPMNNLMSTHPNKIYRFDDSVTYQIGVTVGRSHAGMAANGYATDILIPDTYIARYTYYAPVELPPEPTKDGYNFAGWYYNEALTVPYAGESITKDTQLYAKFTPINYSITYNLNGGTLTNGWTSYNIESAAYALPSPTRSYYIFDGWYTNASFSGSPVTTIASGSLGDKSFYAKYTPVTYAITYELNGGSMTGQTVSYNVTSAVINLPTAYKNGYTFGGWYTSSNFSGSVVTTIPTGSNGDKIFYAKYTPIEYSITYYLNGGTLTGQKVTYNIESQTIMLATPALTGYIFKGWYTDSSFTESAVTSIQQGSIGNKTFYAKYELITYTVTFYVDGVIYRQLTVGYGSVLDSYYYADSQMAAVSFYADSARTAPYSLGAEIYNDTVIFASSDFDLYVSLTYSVNGIEMKTDLLDYNATLNNLRVFEIEGYAFGGWYYDEAFAKPVLSTDKITKNITIYAKLAKTESKTIWQKIGAWFTSTVGIVIMSVVGGVIVLGGVGYATKSKKNTSRKPRRR